MNAFLHEQSRGRAARLAGVPEHPEDAGTRGGLHVGIVEDQVRRLAPQLEAHPLHFLPRLRADPLAGAGLAGERDLVDLLAGDDLRADDIPRSRNEIEHALGNPGLLDELEELVRRGRGVARGLGDDGATDGERGRNLARGLRQREVPRRDHPHHADRLLDQVDHGAAGEREALAVELAGQPRVELEDVGRRADVGHGLAHRHADFQADDARETVGVVADQARRAEQHLLAELVVVDPVPDVAVEGGARGVDRGARVVLGSFLGNGRDLAHVRRVLARELPPGRGLAFFAVDHERAVQGEPEGAIVGHESLLGDLASVRDWER